MIRVIQFDINKLYTLILPPRPIFVAFKTDLNKINSVNSYALKKYQHVSKEWKKISYQCLAKLVGRGSFQKETRTWPWRHSGHARRSRWPKQTFRPRERDHCLTCMTVSLDAFTVRTQIIVIQQTEFLKRHNNVINKLAVHVLISEILSAYSYARTFTSEDLNWNVTHNSSLNLQCGMDSWSFLWESQRKFQATSCAWSSHRGERLKCWQLLRLPLDASGTQAFISQHRAHTLGSLTCVLIKGFC